MDDDVEMDLSVEEPNKEKGKAKDDDIVNPQPDPDIQQLFDENPALTVQEFFTHMGDKIKQGEISKPRLERKRLGRDSHQSSKPIEAYLERHADEGLTFVKMAQDLATLGRHTKLAIDEGEKKEKGKISTAFGFVRLYVFTIGPQELILQKNPDIDLPSVIAMGRYGESLAMEGVPFRFNPVNFEVEESLRQEAVKPLLTMMMERSSKAVPFLCEFRRLVLPYELDRQYTKLDFYKKLGPYQKDLSKNLFDLMGTVLIAEGASWENYEHTPDDYREPLDKYLTGKFGQELVSDLAAHYTKTSIVQASLVAPSEAERESAFTSNFLPNPDMSRWLTGDLPVTQIGELFYKLSPRIPKGLLEGRDEDGIILFDALITKIDPSMNIREVMGSPLTYFDATRRWVAEVEQNPKLSDQLNAFNHSLSLIQRACFPTKLQSVVVNRYGDGNTVSVIRANACYLAEYLERRRVNAETLNSEQFAQQILGMLEEKQSAVGPLVKIRTLLHHHPMDDDTETMLFDLIDDDDIDMRRSVVQKVVKKTANDQRLEVVAQLIATFLMTRKDMDYKLFKTAPRNMETAIRAGLANIHLSAKTSAFIRIADEFPKIDEKRLYLARRKRKSGLGNHRPAAVIDTFIYAMHDKAEVMRDQHGEEDTPMAEALAQPRFNLSDLCRLFRVSTEEPTADHLFAPIVDMRRQNNIANLPKEMGITEREIKDFVDRLDLTPAQWKEELFPLLFELGTELRLKERDLSVWKSSEPTNEVARDDEWEDIEDDEDIVIGQTPQGSSMDDTPMEELGQASTEAEEVIARSSSSPTAPATRAGRIVPQFEKVPSPHAQTQGEIAEGSNLNHVFFVRRHDAPDLVPEEYQLSDETIESQQTCHSDVAVLSIYFPMATKKDSWEDRQKNAGEFNEPLATDEDAYMKLQERRLREEIEPTLVGENPPSDKCFRVGFAENMGKGVYSVSDKTQQPGARMMFGGALLLTKKQRKNYIEKHGRDAYYQYAVTVEGNRKQRKFVWAPVGGGNDAQFFNTADIGVTSDPDKAHFKLRDVVIVMRNRRGQKRRIYAAYVDQVRRVRGQGLLYYGPKYRLKKNRSNFDDLTLTPANPFTAAVLKADWLTPEQIGELHDAKGQVLKLMSLGEGKEKFSNVKSERVIAENWAGNKLKSFMIELEANEGQADVGQAEHKLIRDKDVPDKKQWKTITDAFNSADDVLPAFITDGKHQRALLKKSQQESGTVGTRANSPTLSAAEHASSASTTARTNTGKRPAPAPEQPPPAQLRRSTRKPRGGRS